MSDTHIILVWTEEAMHDLKRVHDFLKKENPRAALAALLRIKESTRHPLEYPDIGAPYKDGISCELIGPFGANAYILRYRRDNAGNIVVIHVWHSRKNR